MNGNKGEHSISYGVCKIDALFFFLASLANLLALRVQKFKFLDEFCTNLSIYTLFSSIRSKFDSITEMLLNLSSVIEDLVYAKILLRR